MTIGEATDFLLQRGVRVERNIQCPEPGRVIVVGWVVFKGDFRHVLKDDSDLIEFAEAVSRVV